MLRCSHGARPPFVQLALSGHNEICIQLNNAKELE